MKCLVTALSKFAIGEEVTVGLRQDGYDIRDGPPSGRGACAVADQAKMRPLRVSPAVSAR